MEKEINTLQKFIDTSVEFLTNYSFQVVGAILVLVIGNFVGKWLHAIILGFCEKKKMDITLSKFLAGCVKILVMAFAILIALSKFGITITPFIAMLGAGAFGVTMALQGPLSNYGAGVSIIIGRPFVVGDTIHVKGQTGVVKEVSLASTVLTDEDGVKIMIPNKHIMGEIIHNSFRYKIVENTINISYGCDPAKAIQTIQDTIAGFKEVSKAPKPQIGFQEFGEYSIKIGCRYWIPTVRYFQMLYGINLAIHKALAESKITIPYPQQTVHLVNSSQ